MKFVSFWQGLFNENYINKLEFVFKKIVFYVFDSHHLLHKNKIAKLFFIDWGYEKNTHISCNERTFRMSFFVFSWLLCKYFCVVFNSVWPKTFCISLSGILLFISSVAKEWRHLLADIDCSILYVVTLFLWLTKFGKRWLFLLDWYNSIYLCIKFTVYWALYQFHLRCKQ